MRHMPHVAEYGACAEFALHVVCLICCHMPAARQEPIRPVAQGSQKLLPKKTLTRGYPAHLILELNPGFGPDGPKRCFGEVPEANKSMILLSVFKDIA